MKIEVLWALHKENVRFASRTCKIKLSQTANDTNVSGLSVREQSEILALTLSLSFQQEKKK